MRLDPDFAAWLREQADEPNVAVGLMRGRFTPPGVAAHKCTCGQMIDVPFFTHPEARVTDVAREQVELRVDVTNPLPPHILWMVHKGPGTKGHADCQAAIASFVAMAKGFRELPEDVRPELRLVRYAFAEAPDPELEGILFQNGFTGSDVYPIHVMGPMLHRGHLPERVPQYEMEGVK